MKSSWEGSFFPVIKNIFWFFDKKKEWMTVLPPLLVPCVFHSAEGEKREHSSRQEMMERKVEVELWHIQQQMQYYYSRKQELK